MFPSRRDRACIRLFLSFLRSHHYSSFYARSPLLFSLPLCHLLPLLICSCGVGHNRPLPFPTPVSGIHARPAASSGAAASAIAPSTAPLRIAAMDVSSNESSAVVTSDGLLYRFGDCRWSMPGGLPMDVNERQQGHGSRAFLEAAGVSNGNSPDALVPGVLVWPTLYLPLEVEPHADAEDSSPCLGVCWGAAPVFLAPPTGAVQPPLPSFQAVEPVKPPAAPFFPAHHQMQRPGFGGPPGRPGAPGARPMAQHFPIPQMPPVYRPPQYVPRSYSAEEEAGTQAGFCYWAAPGRRIRAPAGAGGARVNVRARITSVAVERFCMWATDAEGRLYSCAAWQQAGQQRYFEDLPSRFLTPVAGFGPPPHGASVTAACSPCRAAVAVFHGRHSQGAYIVAARHESTVTAPPVVCADLSIRSPLADAWRAQAAPARHADRHPDGRHHDVSSGRIVYDFLYAGPKASASFGFVVEEDMCLDRGHKLNMQRSVTLPAVLPALSGLPAPPADLSYGCGMGSGAGMITGAPAEGKMAAMMATAAAALAAMRRSAVPGATAAAASASAGLGAAGGAGAAAPLSPAVDTSLVLAPPAIQMLAIPQVARPNQPMAVQWRAPAHLAGGPNTLFIFAATGGQPMLKIHPIALRNGAVAFAAPACPGRYVAVLSLGANIQDIPTWAGRVTVAFSVTLRVPLLRGLSFTRSCSSGSGGAAIAELFASNRKPGHRSAPFLAPREASSLLIRALSPFLPLSALPYLAVGTRSMHRALPWSAADVIAMMPAEADASTAAPTQPECSAALHGSSALVAGSHAALSAADGALAGATGTAALLPRPLPPVGSSAWWWSRPLPLTGVTSSINPCAPARIAVFNTQPRLLDSDSLAARAQAAIAARAAAGGAGAATGRSTAGSVAGAGTDAAAKGEASEVAGGDLAFAVSAAGAADSDVLSGAGGSGSAGAAAAALAASSREADSPEHEQLWLCGPTREVSPGPYVLAWVGLTAAAASSRSAAMRHSLAPLSYPADAHTPGDPASSDAVAARADGSGSLLADGSNAYAMPAHLVHAAREAGAVVWAHDCSITVSAGAGAPAAPAGATPEADDADAADAAAAADDAGAAGHAADGASSASTSSAPGAAAATALTMVHAAPRGSVSVRVRVTTAGRPVSPRDVLVWADRRDIDARLRSASALAAGELADFGTSFEHMHRVLQKHAADAVGRARLAFASAEIVSDADAAAAAAAAGGAAAASGANEPSGPSGAVAAGSRGGIAAARARAALAAVTAASKIARATGAAPANSPLIHAASLAEAMAAAQDSAGAASSGSGAGAAKAWCDLSVPAPSTPGDYVLLLLLEDHLLASGGAGGAADPASGAAAAAAPQPLPLRLAAQSGRVRVLITKIPLSERMAAKRAEREERKAAIAGRLTERALERRAKATEAVAAARERGAAALAAARARAAERAEQLRLRGVAGPSAAAAHAAMANAGDRVATANAAAAAPAPSDDDNDDDDDYDDDEEPRDFIDGNDS